MELENQIIAELEKITAAQPYKFSFSQPAGNKYTKAAVTQISPDVWQIERFTQTQAFHSNIEKDALSRTLAQILCSEFLQLTATAENAQYQLKITKKGKILFNKNKVATPAKPAAPHAQAAGNKQATATAAHNREKNYLLPEGTVIQPLVDMGIFTADGRVVAAMYHKYRQINRFVELIHDSLKGTKKSSLHVLDFGCGKSYLTFILYYYLVNILKVNATITGLDLKADVVKHCNEAAQRYGYTGLSFKVGDIAKYSMTENADMVITLHACDTATDYALAGAVTMGAEMVFSVPCCQHQLNSQIESSELSLLTRYGIIKERTAALMTDAIRANLLTACGYKTQLVEFVDTDHTPKNILIRAVKSNTSITQRKQVLDEVTRLCAAFGLKPCLLDLLEGKLP